MAKVTPCFENGNIAIAEGLTTGVGLGSSELIVFRTHSILTRYLFYYLRNDQFMQLAKATMTGTGGLKRVAPTFVGDYWITLPNEKDQQNIIEFLDGKCQIIDDLIALQEQEIEKLKEYKQSVITHVVIKGLDDNVQMKESSIKTYPFINDDSQLKQLRHIVDLFGRIGYRGYTQADLVSKGEGAITLSPSNMQGMKIVYDNCTYLSWFKYFESPEIQIENGDILFVKTGSTYGKSALVVDKPMEATINPQILVMKNCKINVKYLLYCLQTSNVRDLVECYVVGGTIPTISQDKVGRFHIPVYTELKCNKIVDFLDDICNKIDHLIEIKQSKIGKIKQYKKSLIYEYVTGKKEVI